MRHKRREVLLLCRAHVWLKAAFAGCLWMLPHSVLCQQPQWTATWVASPEAADPDPDEPFVAHSEVEDSWIRRERQLRVPFDFTHGKLSTPLLRNDGR
jgi:hypothetical protein